MSRGSLSRSEGAVVMRVRVWSDRDGWRVSCSACWWFSWQGSHGAAVALADRHARSCSGALWSPTVPAEGGCD